MIWAGVGMVLTPAIQAAQSSAQREQAAPTFLANTQILLLENTGQLLSKTKIAQASQKNHKNYDLLRAYFGTYFGVPQGLMLARDKSSGLAFNALSHFHTQLSNGLITNYIYEFLTTDINDACTFKNMNLANVLNGVSTMLNAIPETNQNQTMGTIAQILNAGAQIFAPQGGATAPNVATPPFQPITPPNNANMAAPMAIPPILIVFLVGGLLAVLKK